MNDDVLIALAIERAARSRYRLLLADPKKRRRVLDELNHRPRLDPRRTVWFNSFAKAVAAVDVKPTNPVYMISDAPELDQKVMSFRQAIEDVRMHGWGTIILVSPGLALYYGEQGESAAVIRREA